MTEKALPPAVASLMLALQTLPTDAGRRNFLGHAYKSLVGYDPFEDDPNQTVEEIAKLYLGVMQCSFLAEYGIDL